MPTVIFFAHEQKNNKKNPQLTRIVPCFFICLLHKFDLSSVWIFLVLIIHLFPIMAEPLQAKPSTLVQFISKPAATSWPKIK